MSEARVSALLARTAAAASRGECELFKTTSLFDWTATHRESLGDESPHVEKMAT